MTIQEQEETNPSSSSTISIQHPQNAKPQSMWLYDSQTQSLLQQAHDQALQKQQKEDAEANRLYPVVRTYDEDIDQLSLPSEEEEDEGEPSPSSASSSSEGEEPDKESASGSTTSKQAKQKATKKKELTPKQTKRLQQEIHQHRTNLIKTAVPLCIQEEEETAAREDSNDYHYTHNLQLPTALLSKSEQQYGTPISKAKAFLDLSNRLATNENTYIVVLLLQSGKFAGGVFSQGGTCLQHKTMQKYTVRKGQGKAQSAQDGKRRPKSMGSQLRRQGELQLKEDVQTLLWKDWKTFLEKACLILISCPKTMLSTLLDAPPQWKASPPVLSRKDARIRKIPMTVGRPTYESVYMVHQVLLHVSLEPMITNSTPTSCADETDTVIETAANENHNTQPKLEDTKEDETIPMLHLHHLCQAGNHVELLDWLQTSDTVESFVNRPAGTDFMTPLHYAASASSTSKNDDKKALPEEAAACVYDLLVRGKADPTVLDSRLRPPYFLAGHDKVREAFRKARAVLGEDHCDWKASQVGPPLSEEVLEQRKQKEAEKRRRKKAKAKEKKAKERQAQEEAAAKKAQQEQDEEKSKREAGGRACDSCGKPIRGRKNVFKRLEYVYCSTKCVNDHKRDLMASAALARFGG